MYDVLYIFVILCRCFLTNKFWIIIPSAGETKWTVFLLSQDVLTGFSISRADLKLFSKFKPFNLRVGVEVHHNTSSYHATTYNPWCWFGFDHAVVVFIHHVHGCFEISMYLSFNIYPLYSSYESSFFVVHIHQNNCIHHYLSNSHYYYLLFICSSIIFIIIVLLNHMRQCSNVGTRSSLTVYVCWFSIARHNYHKSPIKYSS